MWNLTVVFFLVWERSFLCSFVTFSPRHGTSICSGWGIWPLGMEGSYEYSRQRGAKKGLRHYTSTCWWSAGLQTLAIYV